MTLAKPIPLWAKEKPEDQKKHKPNSLSCGATAPPGDQAGCPLYIPKPTFCPHPTY